MMTVVAHKAIPFESPGRVVLDLPLGAEVLNVIEGANDLRIRVRFDPAEQRTEQRGFHVVLAGVPYDIGQLPTRHVGTNAAVVEHEGQRLMVDINLFEETSQLVRPSALGLM